MGCAHGPRLARTKYGGKGSAARLRLATTAMVLALLRFQPCTARPQTLFVIANAVKQSTRRRMVRLARGRNDRMYRNGVVGTRRSEVPLIR
jgi:hypothetical protein